MTRFNSRRPARAAIVAGMGETVRVEFDHASSREFARFLAGALRQGAADAAALAATHAAPAVPADMRQLTRLTPGGRYEAAYIDETGRNVRWVPSDGRSGPVPADWRPLYVRQD